MRPADLASGEPRKPGLFEQWMGMTPEEWEALGEFDNSDDDQRRFG
jgi:hypothetical protein